MVRFLFNITIAMIGGVLAILLSRLLFNRITISMIVGLVIGIPIGASLMGMAVVHEKETLKKEERSGLVLNEPTRETSYGLWYNWIKP